MADRTAAFVASAVLLIATAAPAAPRTTTWRSEAPAGGPAVVARPATRPHRISGVYPHLAALGGEGNEFGIGILVPWAGRLWMKTYSAGGPGNLYSIDDDLTLRLEDRGQGLGNRLIHRETNQLFIGHWAIDADGEVRRLDAPAVRHTAAMRHLTDPANRIYLFGMEGEFLEVDVHTLRGSRLFRVQEKGVTGAHGKGGYTGQSRVVVANNGGTGALAQWDGKAQQWDLLERKQFCEVTGPGGISGAARDDDPIWATGWDHRSVILKVLDKGQWHTYRLPKASYSYDAGHGWFTEWPRIRETMRGKYMMDMHGMYYDFPGDFAPGRTGGLNPIASHARMTADWCVWKDQLVLAHDDTSGFGNPLCGQAQSNLSFYGEKDLAGFGPPSGWGGPWVREAVKAGEPSEPFLLAGFAKRIVHLAHTTDSPVSFTIQVDADGSGKWTDHQTIAVAARGYAWHIFAPGLAARWVRLRTDRDCTATAYFHYSGGSDRPATSIACGLAHAETTGECAKAHPGPHRPVEGTVIPHYSPEGRLHFAASTGGPDGKPVALGLYEVTRDMHIVPAPGKSIHAKTAIGEPPSHTGRLPGFSADSPYAMARGARAMREVVTERDMLNYEGTIYDVPRDGGIRRARPITTHGRFFTDFCTWRGLLVLAGARTDAAGDGHVFRSEDGKTALWFGQVEDLWQMGKPRGVGGPWRKTTVTAGAPSPEYMMTGFDRKRVELSHDAAADVTFAIEVDFLADKTGSWHRYGEVNVATGQTMAHRFPDGYSAHWVRLVASRPCAATATFTYE